MVRPRTSSDSQTLRGRFRGCAISSAYAWPPSGKKTAVSRPSLRTVGASKWSMCMWLISATSMRGSSDARSEAGVSRGTTRIAPERFGSVSTVRLPMRKSTVACPTQTAESGAARSSGGSPRTAGSWWATMQPQTSGRTATSLLIDRCSHASRGAGK